MSSGSYLYLGVDPGVRGGYAVVDADGGPVLVAGVDATDELAVQDMVGQVGRLGQPVRAVLEFVRASPQMGVVSAFTFGRGYGTLRYAVLVAGWPLLEVTPGKWQREMGVRGCGDKRGIYQLARERFGPVEGLTQQTADALWLAAWGRRAWQQGLGV